jgi:3D-(3,5/4)-trihydroxycyclohexane-1,2-dione acylhydrolase (decyclizing)
MSYSTQYAIRPSYNREVNFMATQRLTMAQAIVQFLKNQYIERDGLEQPFFAGCFGIFGHGNVAGMGQALQQYPDFRYRQIRNEQAMVHTAVAYAKMKNRLQTFACTTSIGPGALNMVTGAAVATVNRLPVLLLPGDIFARRNVAPVLQQIESEHSQDVSANDCFKPVSRYWDRLNRADQILTSLPEAMRILTSPVETGAVTLALPQDVQAEAYDYPEEFFRQRVWRVARNRPDRVALEQAAQWIRASKRPLIVCGGGVLYSEATETLRQWVEQTGIPSGETMAGKGSLLYDHPLNMGAVGATGTLAANRLAKEADLIIGLGTRYSDFTTASKTAFQHPDVRFININVAEFDAYKHHALPVIGDAKATLAELLPLLEGYQVDPAYRAQAQTLHNEWEAEVDRIYDIRHQPLVSQGELIGAVNDLGDPEAVMVCAAGSLPGDLHKLWRARHAKQYHMEYGFSCMGYEIAGGLGVKMADPEREVYVLVGDGSYLMLSADIITSVQEGYKLTIVLIDNDGYKSIGALSRSLGQTGFGTRYVYPSNGGLPDDNAQEVKTLPIDLPANARSLGAHVIECQTYEDFVSALKTAKTIDQTTVIYIQNDRYVGVPGYESWWDVPVAEVSELDTVRAAREEWEEARTKERYFL